ncbi:cilium assembly protein DZIP1L [Perognathus longimembris pacificus]|uniref:cilium assembly protein DZIP1L n=1 Tax=Perognathus longimembris pacificus TaxID=214514 RepID=UPI002018B04D|nr:cilium assembly protein DZIP1L [Perognathus longimembris pacificus]
MAASPGQSRAGPGKFAGSQGRFVNVSLAALSKSGCRRLLLAARRCSEVVCHLCDKTFMSAAFLRGHLQRRHAGHAEDGDGGAAAGAGGRLEELRAQLKCTQGQLEAQQAADRQRQLQEVESMRQREMEAKKEFDEWKERERSKFYGEIDKLKQLFWDEFKVVANQNSTLEEKLQALQARGAVESHLGSLRDEEAEERLRQAQELQALREKMELQKAQWKRKMKQLDQERAAERRELQEENERLRASLSQDERKMDAQAQRQLRALRAQLQEQARRIASQEDMIQALSARKVEEAQAVPQPVDVDVDDSSEEEPDDAREDRRKVLEALRQNATLLKQFRPILEDTLQEKLEGLGIKRDARGISTDTLGRLEGLLRARREGKARTVTGFLPLRAELAREATSRATAGAPQPHGQPPVTRQPRTPTPRRTRRPESHRGGAPHSTPPFSSEEEEEGGAAPPRRPQPDLDWSDTDFSEEEEEEDGRGPGRGSGGLASSGTLVQAMVRNLQKQLEVPARKPAGGVSVLGGPGRGPRRGGPAPAPAPAPVPATAPATPGGRPQLSEESELEISSLEDLSPSPGGKQPPAPSAAARPAPPGRLGRPSFPAW